MVLLGAGILGITLTEPVPMTTIQASSSGEQRVPASVAAQAPRPTSVYEVVLDCEMNAMEIPEMSAQVRIKIPHCGGLQVIAVHNETNQIEGSLFRPKDGSTVTDFIGLAPGENRISLVFRQAERQPASQKVLTVYRKQP